jgi:hypothetical protein
MTLNQRIKELEDIFNRLCIMINDARGSGMNQPNIELTWEQCNAIVTKEVECRTMRTMTKHITHCENCGGSWYDDGLTSECPCKTIKSLRNKLENFQEKADAIHRYLKEKKPDAILAVVTELSLESERRNLLKW